MAKRPKDIKPFEFEDPTGTLNERQMLFCMEYVKCKFNGRQAAKNAGYSDFTANEQASRLLTNVNIQNYINELKKDVGRVIGVDVYDIANQYKKIGFHNIKNILTVDGGLKPIYEIDDDDLIAVAGIESFDETSRETGEVLGTIRKIKLSDKIQALDKLARMLNVDGLSKVASVNPDGSPVQQGPFKVQIVEPTDE